MLYKFIATTVAAVAATLGSQYAQAQAFPSGTVTIVVPFTPGGSSDAWLRPLAKVLSDHWKQPVVLEHKPGAGTTLGAAYVAEQKPDGHKLYATTMSAHLVSARLLKSVKYDALKSFTAVSGAVDSPYVILVNPSSSIGSIGDLIAHAKANPGKMTFGSSGNGTGSHLSGEALKQTTGINTIHVPFKGSGPVITALLGGHVDYVATDVSSLSAIRAGQLRPLAVTSPQRSASLPNTPTLSESVARGFDVTNQNVILGPAGIDPKVTLAIKDAVHRGLANEDIRKLYATMGLVPHMLGSEELRQAMQADDDKLGRLIQQIGLKPE
jgi:tripartite-type tricarboxylate transporter receptor subunit TctC